MSTPEQAPATTTDADATTEATGTVDTPTDGPAETGEAPRFGFGEGSAATPVLDSIEEQFGKFVDAKAVRAAQGAFEQQAEEIRADESLSETGRKAALALAWTQAREKLDATRSELLVKVDQERNLREGRAFGPANKEPAERIAHRDALDRADKVATEEEALKAVRRARISGDTSMLRALTMRASDARWDDALDALEQASPGTRKALDAIQTLPNVGTFTTDSFFRLRIPAEFGSGKADTALSELRKALPRKGKA